MQPELRHCLHCKLVFEGKTICPSCHRDVREQRTPDDGKEPRAERRRTTEVPAIPRARK